LLVAFLGITSGDSHAQSLHNYRVKLLANQADTFYFDSLSIIPGSLIIRDAENNLVSEKSYWVDYPNAVLALPPSYENRKFPLEMSYRVFPISFTAERTHKNATLLVPDPSELTDPFVYTYKKSGSDIFGMGSINKSGSISRGVNFGNSQDVTINSSLDLRLAGKVSDNVSILAAITDDNIPIQPDGNTQQIQEFDKVFIQLYDKNSTLIAGDFEIGRPKSHFMNFYKKAQGASFSTGRSIGGDKAPGRLTVETSAAISKGKFARNTFNAVEGNQGPYKLTGNENEVFIIIISGTERVYMDGALLMRGQDRDYVIDYNTAEITFTPGILLTKDKRIVVEFQYSDRNYTRSLAYGRVGYEKGKLQVYGAIYSEQDAKNQPIDQDLSEEHIELFREIGDNLDSAIVPKIDSAVNTEIGVFYQKKDSLGYAIYVYSADSGVFQLGFSNVGQGNGNYMQDVNEVANGRVFKWVAPDTLGGLLVMNGTYEPIVKLVTPKKRQMAIIGGKFSIGQNTSLIFETAVSNDDLNTFSSLDDGNNVGAAIKLSLRNKRKIGGSSEDPWNLISTVNYEQIDKQFVPIERFRKVEFDRNWNIKDIAIKGHQYLPGLSLELMQKSTGSFKYAFSSFIQGEQNTGYRNHGALRVHKKGMRADFTGGIVQSSNNLNTSQFIRSKGVLSQDLKWVTIGIKEEQENNIFRDAQTDTLTPSSYEFYDWTVFVRSPDTVKNKLGFSYGQRTDLALDGNTLTKSTIAENMKMSFGLLRKRNNTLNGSVTYRKLDIENADLTSNTADESVISRLEHRMKLWKGALTATTFYQIGSGLEVKRQFYYQKILAEGQGVYEWIDRDSNGVESLDEFEIAAYQYNANYIRIYVPTNDYIKTFSTMFNEAFYLRPSAVWKNSEGPKKFLARFSNQMTYRVSRKSENPDLTLSYNPFILNDSILNDSATGVVTLLSSFRNIFFFNRTNRHFGADIKYQDTRNKSLLVNGLDSRQHRLRSAYLRWNINRQFTWNFLYALGEKSNSSEFLSSKDYEITYVQYEPRVTYQPNTKLRFTVYYTNKNKENLLMNDVIDPSGDTTSFSGGERAVQNTIGLEIKHNHVSKGSLAANIDYIDFSYIDTLGNDAQQNTALGYEMLEGLQTGGNITWHFTYQRNISKHMQLSITYDGRKSEETPAIHRGGIQLRAYFQ